MEKTKIRVVKLSKDAVVPVYATDFAAGADLRACLDGDSVTVAPRETVFIKTGIALEIPEGLAGFIYARSGISCKRGLAPANKVGVIDSDYRGEITVALYNHSDSDKVVENGERIAQLVIAPYVRAEFTECDTLKETERGSGGFGSTGK